MVSTSIILPYFVDIRKKMKNEKKREEQLCLGKKQSYSQKRTVMARLSEQL